ncbi:hypothetical protein ABER99_20340 [Paenibacillus glucanolyticus]|jgi:hypothetical protein|uniref:Uncharacterized protein n=1 Tax=Paenibacillus glucanolyticus TaxID=59843 RepID=A0A163GJ18_9BACL|nr:hypothetical protein [Paenibacillus glucanolyticus]KZS44998.1 hypothetical protein AWU65_03180 [Paenibacillus glucanolyticus]OMF64146.1 hypothetical protein BK142_32150 [Paenibacillus glucanolyticus]
MENPNQLFSIKKPCNNCPFLIENDLNLKPGRLEEIIRKLHDNIPFHCHKTIDYSKESIEDQVENASYCGGSMVYLKKCNNTNVPMRLGQLLGYLNPDELRGEEIVIEPLGLDVYVRPKQNDQGND